MCTADFSSDLEGSGEEEWWDEEVWQDDVETLHFQRLEKLDTDYKRVVPLKALTTEKDVPPSTHGFLVQVIRVE